MLRFAGERFSAKASPTRGCHHRRRELDNSGRAGFAETHIVGLLGNRTHIQEVIPFDDEVANFHPNARALFKERIKSHPWFVPAFGVRASTSASCDESVWERVVAEMSNALATFGAVRFHRSLVTDKGKVLFFGKAGHAALVLKVGFDETSRENERRNWTFITHGENVPELMTPRPLFRNNR